MAHYHLLTIWRIQAPLDSVYAAIHNTPGWTDWWPGVMKVEKLAAGDADGINSVLRYVWQGRLPYRMVFEVRATRIEAQVAIEGTVQGDLEGVGRWRFAHAGAVSTVRYEWHVHSTRWWMNLVAPFARPLFIRNHGHLMQQGAEGLARMLGAPLLSQENIDLKAGVTNV
ncbi:MAG: SRPBCC family protein [Thiobacillus sp.]|uniref:SRPBCC family protein n=1 Tax=Thiobacillus sp. TaxID=924 RepID=UPI002735CDD3|nr:SRPBCC family protein [Thiobacillus sp.]MDP3586204.1 SRPBCC family protein [Thiobacillus sp.]